MELQLKHLAPYLPYGLKFTYQYKTVYKSDCLLTIRNIRSCLDSGKPILRPLSDLTKEENHLKVLSWYENTNNAKIEVYKNDSDSSVTVTYDLMGDVFTDFIYNRDETSDTRYWIMEELLKNHFDVFGLIEKGLAVDVNKID